MGFGKAKYAVEDKGLDPTVPHSKTDLDGSVVAASPVEAPVEAPVAPPEPVVEQKAPVVKEEVVDAVEAPVEEAVVEETVVEETVVEEVKVVSRKSRKKKS